MLNWALSSELEKLKRAKSLIYCLEVLKIGSYESLLRTAGPSMFDERFKREIVRDVIEKPLEMFHGKILN